MAFKISSLLERLSLSLFRTNLHSVHNFTSRYEVIAVGIGEGQNEDLENIAVSGQKYMRVPSFDKLTEYCEKIKWIIDNPGKGTFRLGLLVSQSK